jgi:hypothetical protein
MEAVNCFSSKSHPRASHSFLSLSPLAAMRIAHFGCLSGDMLPGPLIDAVEDLGTRNLVLQLSLSDT